MYVVTEEGCMKPGTGAFQHIGIGIRELSKSFDLSTSLPHCEQEINHSSFNSPKPLILRCSYINGVHNNILIGGLRDIKYFLKKVAVSLKLLRVIRSSNVDFIYVRASFLDPLPILLHIAHIPCFVEANGLQFESRKKYYLSFLTLFNKFYERLIYSFASHVFFIGSYGEYWKINSDKWSNIENGVTYKFLSQFSEHKKEVTDKINLAFVGRLMAHHQPELLIKAIQDLDSDKKSKIRFHLIGSKLDIFSQKLQDNVEVIEHGFLNPSELAACLEHVHIGLIPGFPQYQSQMKLFDYGAAKCVVLAPRVFNLEYWFDDSEIEFFKAGNPQDLVRVLSDLIENIFASGHPFEKGEKLHRKISDNFTWEKIFEQKAELIKSKLSIKTVYRKR